MMIGYLGAAEVDGDETYFVCIQDAPWMMRARRHWLWLLEYL